MPGKVNPTQAEALTVVCCQEFGNQTVITTAATQGHLELNAYKPVIAPALLRSEHCVGGIAPDTARIADLVEKSLMRVTALVPQIGVTRRPRL
jgi:fumarate hydratase, class II